MTIQRSLAFLILLLAPLALSACGEEWVAVKTTDYFPYGNQRTAGSGVVYVLAKMLPEHNVKLEMQQSGEKLETDEAPVIGADAVFKKALRK